MDYKTSIKYLDAVAKTGSRPGLDSINRLLEELQYPQDDLQVIHIAGTNGKGSTCAMLNSILVSSGYKVGLFMSPYIFRYNETIKVNNNVIDDKVFSGYVSLIKEKCDKIVNKGYDHPTIFEIITAIALNYFSKENVDYVILEVGLGGKYDATNVIKQPLLSIITSIGLDHTEFLGNTYKEIATHKGGIIKKNRPVVISKNNEEVIDTLIKISAEKKAPLYMVDKEKIEVVTENDTIKETKISVLADSFTYKSLFFSMKGEHQLDNLKTVLLAVNVLKNFMKISEVAVREGLLNSFVPCRAEIINKGTPFLLDGAHNKEAIKKFCDILLSYFKDNKKILVFGVLKDKPYIDMFNIIKNYVDEIIITEPISERSLKCNDWKKEKINLEKITYINNYKKAINRAILKADKNTIIACVGSFYLVYPVREYISHI
ncbi:MAG: bifunctional folylpolyglutamate synthase/dihydrofolate synthase [Eubacteriales bacterium]